MQEQEAVGRVTLFYTKASEAVMALSDELSGKDKDTLTSSPMQITVDLLLTCSVKTEGRYLC